MNSLYKERRPSWFRPGSYLSWQKTFLMTLLLMGLSVLILVAYSHVSNDLTPDSPIGYSYAVLGSAFMLLATFSYTRTRKKRHRKVGEINRALNWHVCFGIVALFLLFLHSFGNFNPRSGTYALYGMVTLVLSGIIGKILDSIGPRIITKEASKALTNNGDDRIENIAHNMQDIVSYNVQDVQMNTPRGKNADNATDTTSSRQPVGANPSSMVGGISLPGSWDIAYISLEETPQEISRNNPQYRFVPDRKSALAEPGALMPGYNTQKDDLRTIQKALHREGFYRALIRYWRIFHVILVMITIGLTFWHIEYAVSLLIPVFLHH